MIRMRSCYIKDYPGKWEMNKEPTSYHIIVLITKGNITYWVDEDTVYLNPGDVLYIPAGCQRGGFAVNDHQRFVTHFSMDDGDRRLLPLLGENRHCKTPLSGLDYFKQRFMLLRHHWLMGGPYQEATRYGILLEMLGIISYDRDNWKVPAKKLDLAADIRKYLLDHYREPVTLDDLASYTGRTPNYISHLFKRISGFSPIDYLHHVRIAKAKELMFDKKIPIGEIAERTGFCDQAYFTRVFKKLTGCSPTAFLKGSTD
ncbi:AraC family transcriptional regulator [Paenibacillus humicola]|uniref:AraC family transcriptional regulator n=1 Tax=Paenibacillus humicola TaxID=3110540 RepID=UPI00237BC2BA|nr:AraC family transcriptional regulator [Paenibacillus humicola]